VDQSRTQKKKKSAENRPLNEGVFVDNAAIIVGFHTPLTSQLEENKKSSCL
jgi:hypothetical protein